VFYVYGGRYLVKPGPRGYAFDFVRFLRPPSGSYYYEVAWAREAGGVLYVEHTHLTYAAETRRRNAYLTAIGIESGKILWRSPALVANARTFVVVGDLIVSGYGFTAEPDFLYLLDRRTGKVLDQLAVASAPEVIKLRGDRLHVRTYDRDVVARIVR
jgi:outer membrane protein assembly factor BamB